MSKTKPYYHVATATDELYYVPMYVMLYSLFENNRQSGFHIHVLYSDLDEAQKNEVEQLAKRYDNYIHWCYIDEMRTAGFYVSVYIQVSSYYRIFLPELLPEAVDTVLYLDADILVTGDIAPLLLQDITDTPVIAIKEAVPHNIQRLGIPEGYDYFNAGVLLINLKDWREKGYGQQLQKNIAQKKEGYLMHDQDALNALFYDKVRYTNSQWNHQTGFYHLNTQQLEARYNKPAAEILHNPVIIHFTTQHKPWQYTTTHPYKPLFLQYLSHTPYINFAEKGDISKWLKKCFARLKHKIGR